MDYHSLSPEAQGRRAELPTPNSTHSYWHRAPSEKLLGHRTTAGLPARADVLVIGSGISGAFAARELVAGQRTVVMFDAREACWGATGRNGGHCQPSIWNIPASHARFELATFEMVRDLVASHEVPCDWRVVGGMHPIYDAGLLSAAKAQMERLSRHADLRDKARLILDREELRKRHVPRALGAVYQPCAAKVWPYRLVAWILETLLEGNGDGDGDGLRFNLQMNTPVTRLERKSKEEGWIAHTPRGTIRARDVLLATNAYTSYLIPDLTDVIVPVRGQVAALQPPDSFSSELPHSYVWATDGGEQYMIHRGIDDTQVSSIGIPDRSLILGGERQVAGPQAEEGISRDDTINPLVSVALHRGLAGAVTLFPDPDDDSDDDGDDDGDVLRSTFEWTGIMGYSRDANPWVGSVPAALFPSNRESDGTSTSSRSRRSEKEEEDKRGNGLWISAGFTGHGMPVAPRCGVAVAQMILGKGDDGEAVKVPEEWTPTEARIARARTLELPRSIEETVFGLPRVVGE
ncbi:FAD dependent oxidoreductase [Xylariaceae sp. FL0594]|nr:FAD dependent oxidoreductase [Xylariaceae sp. FL0594]